MHLKMSYQLLRDALHAAWLGGWDLRCSGTGRKCFGLFVYFVSVQFAYSGVVSRGISFSHGEGHLALGNAS